MRMRGSMGTEALVLLGIVAVAAALIIYFGVHGERVKATADARRAFQSATFSKRMHEETEAALARMGRPRRTKRTLATMTGADLTPEEHKIYGDALTTEEAYMKACKECAPAVECERDRLVIVSGRSTDNYNPCE